jgi:hypothetical protein
MTPPGIKQPMREMAAEKNTTMVFPFPMDLVKRLLEKMQKI